jgi:hypothetical protein
MVKVFKEWRLALLQMHDIVDRQWEIIVLGLQKMFFFLEETFVFLLKESIQQ